MKNLKTKKQYRDSFELERPYRATTNYPNMRNQCHKKFSTKPELGINILHMTEYYKEYSAYGFKIRSGRLGGIPNPWDDYKSDVWDKRCWKDRTKRRKQYKPL